MPATLPKKHPKGTDATGDDAKPKDKA
jgi:hypothetical protein